MKRLSILLVSDKNITIKSDYRYVVVHAKTYDETLTNFQNLDFDIVVFTDENVQQESYKMITKLVNVHKRETKILTLEHDADFSKSFIELYKKQDHQAEANFQIQDDALKTTTSCSL